jgi:hypothetical protein
LVPRRHRPLSVIGFIVFARLLASAIPLALASISVMAQTPAPNPSDDLLQPSLDGNPANPPRFNPSTSPGHAPPTGRFTAPAGMGTPVYGSPAGFGAGATGFDSSNGLDRRRAARKPGSGTVSPQQMTFDQMPPLPPQVPSTIPVLPQPPPPQVYPQKAASRPGAVLPPLPGPLPLSNPPAMVYPLAAANRPGAVLPIPPPEDFAGSASTPPPGTPPPNTLPLGAVPRGTLPIAGGDPYEALGIKVGSFLILPALELSGAYSNNPQHVPGGPGSVYLVAAPELHVRSDWSNHSFTADIAGSYSDYLNNSFVPSLSAPYLSAKLDGRIDVLRDTHILLESRLIVSTDNPGSPNIQAGLAKLPILTTVGGTLGLDQQFSRFDVTLKSTIDRTSEADGDLTNGQTQSDAFRNFDQYGGIFRLGYEIDPGLKPFVEVSKDERIYDQLDPFGENRNSDGSSAKIGATLDLSGWLKGEMAAGYIERNYNAPLPNISGTTLDGSLLWKINGLTTAKFTAASAVNESDVQGVSGDLSRDFNVQIDHALRRWLIATLQVGYGRDEYAGIARDDNRYFVVAGLTYKMNRDVWLKATVREDWLTSTATGVAYQATSFLLGLRLQR